MSGAFSELSKAWQSLAIDCGYAYSEEESVVDVEGLATKLDFWRPPVIAASHHNWTIKFIAATQFLPRTFLGPAQYVIFVEAHFTPVKTFDVCLRSTETLAHALSFLSTLDRWFPGGKNSELQKQLFPVELIPSRTNISEIDLHYEIRSHNPEDPRNIFDEPAVREAFLAVPKVGLRICGFPDVQLNVPDKNIKADAILSMEWIRTNDRTRVMSIVNLYRLVLDRLVGLGLISQNANV